MKNLRSRPYPAAFLLLLLALPLVLALAFRIQDVRTSASSPDKLEAEAGVLSSNGVSEQIDSGASGGSYVLFNKSGGPTPTTDPGNCNPVGNTGGSSAITTFHSAGLYWSPSGGSSSREVNVRFRKKGTCTWKQAYPMRYNPISDTTNDKDDYRGSIISLSPNTEYEAELTLEGTSTKSYVTFKTWSENFPEGEVINVGNKSSTYNISTSGTPNAYRVYDGSGSTIDVNNNSLEAMTINANYVIIRGFTIKGAQRHSILIRGGHDIIIENNNISNWGTIGPSGWGEEMNSGIASVEESIQRIIIQRNKIHHPRSDSNSWDEAGHPDGPQCIGFINSAGNHVIRFNECYSDKDHKFNDGFGWGSNGSFDGFPGPDSDIYGNYVANVWDDAYEIEGGGRNIRVWNNFSEDAFISIANAAVSIGPLYIFRNVSGLGNRGVTSDDGGAYWLKAGFASSESWMTGLTYLIHNTVLQPNGKGHGGAGTTGTANRRFKHVVSRNNIYHVTSSTVNCLSDADDVNLDLDFDLCSAKFPPSYGSNGIIGTPIYATNSFDRTSLTGSFTLSSSSKGYQAGEVLPNFSDGFSGNRPDMGAHQNGWPSFKYGVNATFNPLN